MRRERVESAIPVEEVVLGDVVLITAGDNVAADGRIIAASALSIDESSPHRGEHTGVEGGDHAR